MINKNCETRGFQDAIGIALQLVILVLGVGLLIVGRRAREPGTRTSKHLAPEPGPMRDRSVRLALVRLVGLGHAEAVLDSMRVVLVRS
jgi:hypothetical protein